MAAVDDPFEKMLRWLSERCEEVSTKNFQCSAEKAGGLALSVQGEDDYWEVKSIRDATKERSVDALFDETAETSPKSKIRIPKEKIPRVLAITGAKGNDQDSVMAFDVAFRDDKLTKSEGNIHAGYKFKMTKKADTADGGLPYVSGTMIMNYMQSLVKKWGVEKAELQDGAAVRCRYKDADENIKYYAPVLAGVPPAEYSLNPFFLFMIRVIQGKRPLSWYGQWGYEFVPSLQRQITAAIGALKAATMPDEEVFGDHKNQRDVLAQLKAIYNQQSDHTADCDAYYKAARNLMKVDGINDHLRVLIQGDLEMELEGDMFPGPVGSQLAAAKDIGMIQYYNYDDRILEVDDQNDVYYPMHHDGLRDNYRYRADFNRIFASHAMEYDYLMVSVLVVFLFVSFCICCWVLSAVTGIAGYFYGKSRKDDDMKYEVNF